LSWRCCGSGLGGLCGDGRAQENEGADFFAGAIEQALETAFLAADLVEAL